MTALLFGIIIGAAISVAVVAVPLLRSLYASVLSIAVIGGLAPAVGYLLSAVVAQNTDRYAIWFGFLGVATACLSAVWLRVLTARHSEYVALIVSTLVGTSVTAVAAVAVPIGLYPLLFTGWIAGIASAAAALRTSRAAGGGFAGVALGGVIGVITGGFSVFMLGFIPVVLLN